MAEALGETDKQTAVNSWLWREQQNSQKSPFEPEQDILLDAVKRFNHSLVTTQVDVTLQDQITVLRVCVTEQDYIIILRFDSLISETTYTELITVREHTL